MQLSESTSNIIENLACRVAEAHRGRINPHHVLPYLPVSLGLVKSCLDEMADGTSVASDTRDNLVEYEFAAYRNAEKDIPEPLSFARCVACDKDFSGTSDDPLCPSCGSQLKKELNPLAEKMGWPAQAVYEHEILYNAARETGPVHAAKLAASSRYTLRSMRRKLDKLTVDRYAKQELDRQEGVMKYEFPELDYPRDRYRANMAVIRLYPASVMEEVQIKLVKILVTLGLMLLGTLLLAFWAVPFPLLLVAYVIAAPVVAFLIWRHRDAPEDL